MVSLLAALFLLGTPLGGMGGALSISVSAVKVAVTNLISLSSGAAIIAPQDSINFTAIDRPAAVADFDTGCPGRDKRVYTFTQNDDCTIYCIADLGYGSHSLEMEASLCKSLPAWPRTLLMACMEAASSSVLMVSAMGICHGQRHAAETVTKHSHWNCGIRQIRNVIVKGCRWRPPRAHRSVGIQFSTICSQLPMPLARSRPCTHIAAHSFSTPPASSVASSMTTHPSFSLHSSHIF